jgi:hypothetical protein
MEMVGGECGSEASLLGSLNIVQERTRFELFVGGVISKLCHNNLCGVVSLVRV